MGNELTNRADRRADELLLLSVAVTDQCQRAFVERAWEIWNEIDGDFAEFMALIVSLSEQVFSFADAAGFETEADKMAAIYSIGRQLRELNQ